MSNAKPVKAEAPCDVTQVVGRRVKQMNCHAGLILAGLAVTGLHVDKDKCTMTVTPHGVHVQLHKHLLREPRELLVPWANVYFTELMDDAG